MNITQLLSTLITANHILHNHAALDAFGHISVRSPQNASTFYMSAEIAPALVASPNDLVEYLVSDAQPVDPNAIKSYRERYIHSEIYKRFADVGSVVHSHSPEVIPYANTNVQLRASIHMAGFMGAEVPVFDIEDFYNENSTRNLLIQDQPLGAALASYYAARNSTCDCTSPDHTVVLMRGHGVTIVGPDIETAVYRALYTQTNAGLQTAALQLSSSQSGSGGEVRYLSPAELVDTAQMNMQVQGRPWRLWVKEVQRSPLYDNVLDPEYR